MVLALIAAGMAFAGGAAEPQTTAQGFKRVEWGDMQLDWKVNGANAEFRISAPTTGWVAVGFDPSSRMKDANLIIGYVGADGPVARDDFGVAATSHAPDEGYSGSADHITALEGSEQDGRTELRFTLPLDSGDPRDTVLVPGGEHTVILAYGTEDELSAYHAKRTTMKIVF
jgi:hypothetical protein